MAHDLIDGSVAVQRTTPTIDKTILLVEPGEQKEMVPGFGKAIREIARELLPHGWNYGDGSPDSLEAVIRHYETTHQMVVTGNQPKTMVFGEFDDLIAFRAWHDWLHLHYHTEFNLPGELMTGLLHAGDLIRVRGTDRDTQDMIALSLIQVYQQNVYYLGCNTRVQDERRFAMLHFQGWYNYAGELMDHVRMRARKQRMTRELTLTFGMPVPKFCNTLTAEEGFRV